MPPILGPWQEIFPHDVPFEAGSNQIGFRTNARMKEVVKKVETFSFFWFSFGRPNNCCRRERVVSRLGGLQMLLRFLRCVVHWPSVCSQHYFKLDGIDDDAGKRVPNFVITVAYVPGL